MRRQGWSWFWPSIWRSSWKWCLKILLWLFDVIILYTDICDHCKTSFYFIVSFQILAINFCVFFSSWDDSCPEGGMRSPSLSPSNLRLIWYMLHNIKLTFGGPKKRKRKRKKQIWNALQLFGIGFTLTPPTLTLFVQSLFCRVDF